MKVFIEWTYRLPRGKEAVFTSEEMAAEQAVLIAEDLEKTGRTKQVIFIDTHDSSWTLKQMKLYLKGIDTEPHNLIIYFDGGFDLKTNTAGLGCVIYYEQNKKSYRLRKNARMTDLTSNNEAEYAALHLCLQELELLGVHHLPVQILGDSRVVINQLMEQWVVSEPNLNRWAEKIGHKLDSLTLQPHYELISRKLNEEADRLATQAMAGVEILATIEKD